MNINLYHHEYPLGEYLYLIQFYYERVADDRRVLSCEELMRLIAKRKINCHHVKVKRIVMKVVERVEYAGGAAGFIGVVDHLGLHKLGVGHCQYPSYEPTVKAKFRWRVYWLDLGPEGKRVGEEVYEDKDHILATLTGKYVPYRLKMALGMKP